MLDAWLKEGGCPCLAAAGGKSKLPDLLGRQRKDSPKDDLQTGRSSGKG